MGSSVELKETHNSKWADPNPIPLGESLTISLCDRQKGKQESPREEANGTPVCMFGGSVEPSSCSEIFGTVATICALVAGP